MKILMITCQYMPDVFGGAEKQCGRVSKGIMDAGAEVKILTSRQKWRHQHHDIDNGVKVERIYSPFAPDLLGRWSLFSFYWLIRVMIWGALNRSEFDVIHCHQGKFGAFVGCCLARLYNKPILIKVGNSNQFMDFTALKAKKFIGPIMANYVLNTNPTVVAISQVIAKNCADFGFKNIISIPNSINLDLLDRNFKIAHSVNHDTNRISLFYHGRIEDIKKIDILLEAFMLICKQNDNVDFHLIGDGSLLENIKNFIFDQGLDNRVFCYGEVNDPVNFISQFDIFVNASEAEGFSNSMLEALLNGKVMVSTPVSGADDAIMIGQNGFISSDFTANSIYQSIVKGIDLFKQNSNEVVNKSQELIEKKFIIGIIARKYLELYDSMLTHQYDGGLNTFHSGSM